MSSTAKKTDHGAVADRRKYALAKGSQATAVALMKLIEVARTSRSKRTADQICAESAGLQEGLRHLQVLSEAEADDPLVYADGRPVMSRIELPTTVAFPASWFEPVGRTDAFGISPIRTLTYIWHFDPRDRTNTPRELGGDELPKRLYGYSASQWGSVECGTQITVVISGPGEIIAVPAYCGDRFEQMRLEMALRQAAASVPVVPVSGDRFEQMRREMAERQAAANDKSNPKRRLRSVDPARRRR